MQVRQTLYLNEESERKQPTMDFWAYEWLKSDDKESMSKGVKAYEALMFANDEYSDAVSEFEDFVDDQLSTHAPQGLIDALETITNRKVEVDPDSDNRVDSVNIHLPQSLVDQFTFSRYLGDRIGEAVYELAESAYTDRTDRIRCKQELAEYLQDKRITPDHRVAKAVVEGSSDTYTVEDAHKLITDSDESSRNGLTLIDDLSLDELRAAEHTADGDGWSRNKKDKRIEALQTALENEIEKENVDAATYNSDKIAEEVTKVFGVKNTDSYLDRLNVHWVNEMEITAADLARGAKKEIMGGIDSQRKIKKIERTPAYRFVLKEKEAIQNGTGEYTLEECKRRLKDVIDATRSSHTKKGIGQLQWKAHEEFEKRVNKNIEEIEARMEQG